MKSNFISFICGIVIGIIVGFAIIFCSHACIDHYLKPSLPEYIYYVSQLIGVLATTLAVIVAIWGKEIKEAIFKPKCSLWLDNDGFREQLGDTEGTTSPKAKYYASLLCIKNSGNKEINECALFINQITYKATESQKNARTILKNASNIVFWGNKVNKWIGLLTEEQREVTLFRVYPDSASQTPDGCKTSPMRISIMGHNLDERYSKEGIWEITYTLQTKERVLQKFLLKITWSGRWYEREAEMGNELDVNIKML